MRNPRIAELSMGDIFMWRDCLYMKISTYNSFNVVNLNAYYLTWIDPDEYVYFKGSMERWKANRGV